MANPFKPRGGLILIPLPARRNLEPVEFAAPLGGRVRFGTWLAFAIMGAVIVVDVVLVISHHMPWHQTWMMPLAPVAGLGVVTAVFLFSQVRGYRLVEQELLVMRRGRVNRFPLDGLRSVAVDPEAMKFSLKILGNDGLGAIVGRYRNLRLGGYRALVTDRGRAVVLRWSDRCLVVSPEHPAEFAEAVRVRVGLQS